MQLTERGCLFQHLGAPCSCCLFTSNVAHMLMATPRLFATCGSQGDLCLIYASLVVSICRDICLWSAYERGFQQLQPSSCAVLQIPWNGWCCVAVKCWLVEKGAEGREQKEKPLRMKLKNLYLQHRQSLQWTLFIVPNTWFHFDGPTEQNIADKL